MGAGEGANFSFHEPYGVSDLGMSTGDALVRHAEVWRIGLTESVRAGLAIQRAAAEVAVKRVSLELGGKNPMIAFPDANPEQVAARGERPAGEAFRRGYWIRPTVYANVTRGMRVAREEIFGAVLSVSRWRTQEEAIALANATE